MTDAQVDDLVDRLDKRWEARGVYGAATPPPPSSPAATTASSAETPPAETTPVEPPRRPSFAERHTGWFGNHDHH